MNNSKLEAQNAVAVQYGFKDWSDLWINGDLTPAIIEDLMEVYGGRTFNDGYSKALQVVKF